MSAIITDQLRILNSENFVAGMAQLRTVIMRGLVFLTQQIFNQIGVKIHHHLKILLVRRMIIGIQ